MYSKKTLKDALMQEIPENTKWALYPMELNKTESLAVWIVPQKMRLLRLLGIEYALHKKKDDPELMRAELSGLGVERVTTEWISRFYYDGIELYDKPIVSHPAEKPYALVGLDDCRICATKDIGVAINLQHFLDELMWQSCPSVLNWQTDAIFKELCSMYLSYDRSSGRICGS